MICVPAWLPCHTLSHKPDPSGSDCLEAWKLLWFWAWGVECGADDDTNPPPPQSFKKGPRPAVLLWSDSQYCAVSHGEEIILHWLGQAGLSGRRCTPNAERDRKKGEKKKWEKGVLQKTVTLSQKQLLILCYSPKPPVVQHYVTPFSLSVILSALLPWVSAVCSAAKL